MKKTKKELEALLKMFEAALEESSKLWNEKEVSHAYIIGYLEGTIKSAINELK